MSVTPAALRRLMREIKQLKTEPQEGIRIVTNDEDILDVTGIIQGPDGTPYEGGYFKIKFRFTEEFPASPPKCTMLTKIFHPNVSKSGEICVNTLKKDWKREYGIAHILVTVKCLLIYPNPESALDEAAGKLLLEAYEEYCKHAKLMTQVHATPKTRPPEFDIPSVIPATKPTTKATTSTTVATTASTSVSTPAVRHTTPTPNGVSTRLQTSTRQNSPAPTPFSPSSAQPIKPVSKTGLPVEPLQAASNGKNDQNVDPSSVTTIAMELVGKQPPAPAVKTTIPATASANLKRSAGTATGGAEKRKKGLKRL